MRATNKLTRGVFLILTITFLFGVVTLKQQLEIGLFEDAITNQRSGISGIEYLANHQAQEDGEQEKICTQRLILQQQLKQQTVFQSMLRKQQNPVDCSRARILWLSVGNRPMDGFTLEVQMKGRMLMTAMAVQRTLAIPDSRYISAYTPSSCNSSSSSPISSQYECLFEPLSHCNEFNVVGVDKQEEMSATGRGSYGILNTDATSDATSNKFSSSSSSSAYFSTSLFGPRRIVDGNNVLALYGRSFDFKRAFKENVDHIPHWERTMGRFWIRSQIAHYLWRPSAALKQSIQARMPRGVLMLNNREDTSINTGKNGDEKFIGMHIRYSDNAKTFGRDFHRNATVTRSLHHYMELAKEIRSKSNVSTIFLATDSKRTMLELEKSLPRLQQEGWMFWLQNGHVERTDSFRWMWFKDKRASTAAAIATDVECLRRADYLIGSFQSNVFRLAAELNTVYHTGHYPLSDLRHYPVDIEWYEDP